MRPAPANAGFTLIELVMVIVLTGALFATTAIFIVGPTRAYADLTRRAQLVDSADLALRRMARDIHSAIPNSVRVHPSGLAIEMLEATSGARYRVAPDADSPTADPLQFNADDDSFDVLGGFPGIALPFSSSSHYLVVYNLGMPGSDVYAGTDVITPAGTTITIDASSRVTLNNGFRFAWASPQQRIFLSAGVIRYTCDPSSGTLTRQVGGNFVAPVTPYTAGAGDRVSSHITACAFTYSAGSASRSALATLRITLADAGETINLLRQVHVENLP